MKFFNNIKKRALEQQVTLLVGAGSQTKTLKEDEEGGIWSEYGLLIAVAVIIAAIALWYFKDNLVALFNDAGSALRKRN